ncbi:MAG: TetR family transcriptional regulator [Bacteroidetes bacterium]|nr:TetR family transcriptional regulator [Bacteroidota bacterium]
MTTKKSILDKALEMFNEKGIEYVGMRELAASLNMRVSNITYYFPTKDDLVNQLSINLSQLNSEIVVVQEELTISNFLDMLEKVFRNHIKFRCLLLSFVHLLQRNHFISLRYKNTEKDRSTAILRMLQSLMESTLLKTDADLDFLASTLALIIRFWISEASVSHSKLSEQEQIKHYLNIVIKLFLPYVTAKGKRELVAYYKSRY